MGTDCAPLLVNLNETSQEELGILMSEPCLLL